MPRAEPSPNTIYLLSPLKNGEINPGMTKIKLPRPVPSNFKISSPFGNRVLNGVAVHHNGIDFAVPVGTPIKAVADGFAYRAGWEDPHEPKRGYGLRVMQKLKLEDGDYFCWYGHMSKPNVEEGAAIKRGDIVGYSGNTGHSTGPHLHFGIRKSNTNEFQDVQWEGEA